MSVDDKIHAEEPERRYQLGARPQSEFDIQPWVT
jgi:hypothetical protein